MAKRKREKKEIEKTNILKLWEEIFNEGKDENFDEKWSDKAKKMLAKEKKEWQKAILKKLSRLTIEQQKEFLNILSSIDLKENERNLLSLLESKIISLRIKINIKECLEKEGIKVKEVISVKGRKIWEEFSNYQKEDTKELKDEIFTEFLELESFYRQSIIQDLALCSGPYFFKLLDQIDKIGGGFKEDEINIIGSVKSKEAGNFLISLLKEKKELHYIKLIKKNLYRLRSSGIFLEIPDFGEKTQILKKSSTSMPSNAFSSSIDAFGGRLLILLSPSFPKAQYDYISMLLNDHDGITQFKIFPLHAKSYNLNNLIKKIQEDTSFNFIEIPYTHALYLVEECYQKAAKSNVLMDKDFLAWREKQDELNIEEYNHPIYSMIEDLPTNVFSSNFELENTDMLFELKEFLGWFLEPEETNNLINRLEKKPSSLIVTPNKKDKKETPLPLAVAREYFNNDFRKIFKRRLEEMAYYFILNNRTTDARYSLISALGFSNDSLPIEMLPFAVKYIERSLEIYRKEQKKEEQKSLIITPTSPEKLILSPEEFVKEFKR
jgi:hypothetical protein